MNPFLSHPIGCPPMGDEGGNRVHHSAIVVRDLHRSLPFWTDGLGLDVLMDSAFEGDWPTLFGVPRPSLRSVFLGDRRQPGSGVVELVSFEGLDPAPAGGTAGAPGAGFLLLSLYVDLDRVLSRLAPLGVKPEAVIEVDGLQGPVRMATVRDPEGVLVELIDLPSN
jgi:catechol 2,3-dioxygenase-like lactoylglutathione lyase family enzyme